MSVCDGLVLMHKKTNSKTQQVVALAGRGLACLAYVTVVALLAACASLREPREQHGAVTLPAVASVPVTPGSSASVVLVRAPRIGLALGGGAAKGFAHIGVIKVLEAQGISVDYVCGTSAGALVGALYASGNDGFALQQAAMGLAENQISDWSLPDRGFLKGESLQQFVNQTVSQRRIENLRRPFAAVATDLQTGERVVLARGDTGLAVRASAAVPGVFQPVAVQGRELIDGGVVSPVPVREVREMGAEFVIAVDISDQPRSGKTRSTLDVLLQVFTIMGHGLGSLQLPEADIIIRPRIEGLSSASFDSRHQAILEGERAATAMLAQLREKLKAWRPSTTVSR